MHVFYHFDHPSSVMWNTLDTELDLATQVACGLLIKLIVTDIPFG